MECYTRTLCQSSDNVAPTPEAPQKPWNSTPINFKDDVTPKLYLLLISSIYKLTLYPYKCNIFYARSNHTSSKAISSFDQHLYIGLNRPFEANSRGLIQHGFLQHEPTAAPEYGGVNWDRTRLCVSSF